MSNVDDQEVDEIREQKRKELLNRSETPKEPVHVDGEADFEELLTDHHLVLVDFYADWCGPCKAVAPIVAEIAAETDAVVAKVDVDANQSLAANYQVQGIPTLYLFVDGQPTERMVGVQEKSRLVELIDANS